MQHFIFLFCTYSYDIQKLLVVVTVSKQLVSLSVHVNICLLITAIRFTIKDTAQINILR